MIEKKLVEKDVEVTVTQKRLVEVYRFEDKDYHDPDELKQELLQRMSQIYENLLDFSTDKCELVWHTNMRTFQNRMKQPYYRERIFESDKIFNYFDELKELHSLFSQVSA